MIGPCIRCGSPEGHDRGELDEIGRPSCPNCHARAHEAGAANFPEWAAANPIVTPEPEEKSLGQVAYEAIEAGDWSRSSAYGREWYAKIAAAVEAEVLRRIEDARPSPDSVPPPAMKCSHGSHPTCQKCGTCGDWGKQCDECGTLLSMAEPPKPPEPPALPGLLNVPMVVTVGWRLNSQKNGLAEGREFFAFRQYLRGQRDALESLGYKCKTTRIVRRVRVRRSQK